MIFKPFYRSIITCQLIFLIACNSGDETHLVDLSTTASLDIIAINFPIDIETILSINSETDFSLQGLKSNGVDSVTIASHIEWSLSEDAVSSIDQRGHFTAGNSAELITLNAKFGILSESIQIKVSSAKFDQVVQLNQQPFSIDMCRSQAIKPVGRFVDENGDEEIRPVDSTVINTIEWIIRDSVDNELSQRAYIETSANQATLYTLAAGKIVIQATATSLITGNDVTSIDFNQTLNNGLNNIKLCLASDSDLANCNKTDLEAEEDSVLSVIAVGTYQAVDGANFNENISRNSKWGISDTANASIGFSTDRQQLEITGEKENSTATLSVACGDIDQPIDGIQDLSQGITLGTLVSCSSVDCLVSSAAIDIDELGVDSLEVSANGIDLTDNESISLTQRPLEISLIVRANFSNSTNPVITDDNSLVYTITPPTDGQPDVIEEKSGSQGVFTVLGQGTAKINLEFDNKIDFDVVIEIP